MKRLLVVMSQLALLFAIGTAYAADPLPSWNDTAHKKAIVAFVAAVTKAGSPSFVPPAQRIATFDNDGTLWSEQPEYVQMVFTYDRIKALAPQHPEWNEQQPFKAVLENDQKTLAEGGDKTAFTLSMAISSGLTTDEYEQMVLDWVAMAKHPRSGHLYTEMVFKPMLELLAYLRANGFKTFIVSGGGVEFMRPWAERVYGIPPEQVIGSSGKAKFELRDGKAVVVRLPELSFVDDNVGKPVGIDNHIGRRPIASCGNSDGDLQMLQWTTAGKGARLAMLIHHTDAGREWAYDRNSANGKLDHALDEATTKGWIVVDMKSDWKVVYSFEKR